MKKKEIIIVFLVFAVLTGCFVLGLSLYEYLISFKCSSGYCELERSSVLIKHRKLIPVSAINYAAVKVYTAGGRASSSTYYELILNTSQGDVPIIENAVSEKEIAETKSARHKINDYIVNKKSDRLNVSIDRKNHLKRMAVGFGSFMLMFYLVIFTIIFLKTRKKVR